MNAQEFLDFTIKHYNSDNRCVLPGSELNCRYSNVNVPTSKGCAIGQHMTPENAKRADLVAGGGANILKIYKDHPKLLPDWMLKLSHLFLYRVQNLHDNPRNWDEEGLTAIGNLHLAKLKKTFKLN